MFSQNQFTGEEDAGPPPNFVLEAQRVGTDPDFTNIADSLSVQLHDDWLVVLVQENKRRLRKVNHLIHAFFHPRTVSYVMTICLRLRLPHEVKYLALHIFNDYMLQQITNLGGDVYGMDSSESEKWKQWEQVFTTLIRQIPLRTLSSIQIASKICSTGSNMLTINHVSCCLRSLGLAYTHEALRNSELRILVTLNYNLQSVRHTPYTYVESVLAILVRRLMPNIQLDSKLVWEHCLVLLDCIFLRLEAVYRTMFSFIFGEQVEPSRDQLVKLQADYMLMACGVIVMAFFNMHGRSFAENMLPSLHKITDVPLQDINFLSDALALVLLNHEEDSI